jgi:hypothetical protein
MGVLGDIKIDPYQNFLARKGLEIIHGFLGHDCAPAISRINVMDTAG